MVRLALVAMLLMALAPTISRSLQADAGSADSMLVATQMCTTAGLQTKLLTAFLPGASDEQGNGDHPASDHHGAGDACGYCSMVMPIPVLLLSLQALFPLSPVAPDFNVHASFPCTLRNLRGLGAQAPPRSL